MKAENRLSKKTHIDVYQAEFSHSSSKFTFLPPLFGQEISCKITKYFTSSQNTLLDLSKWLKAEGTPPPITVQLTEISELEPHFIKGGPIKHLVLDSVNGKNTLYFFNKFKSIQYFTINQLKFNRKELRHSLLSLKALKILPNQKDLEVLSVCCDRLTKEEKVISVDLLTQQLRFLRDNIRGRFDFYKILNRSPTPHFLQNALKKTEFSVSQSLELINLIGDHIKDLPTLLINRRTKKPIQDFDIARLLVQEYVKVGPIRQFNEIWLTTSLNLQRIKELDEILQPKISILDFLTLLNQVPFLCYSKNLLAIAKACVIKGRVSQDLLNFLDTNPIDSKESRFLEFAIFCFPSISGYEKKRGFFEMNLISQWQLHKDWITSLLDEEMQNFGTLCDQFTLLHPKKINVSIVRMLFVAGVTKLPPPIKDLDTCRIFWQKEAIVLACLPLHSELKKIDWINFIIRAEVNYVTVEIIQHIMDYCLEQMTISGRQGISENNGLGERPTAPKTDFSSSLCTTLPNELTLHLQTGGRIDLPSVYQSIASITEESEEIANKYLVQIPNWAVNYYGDQYSFGIEMHRSVLMGAYLLSSTNKRFNDLINFFAYRRKIIALSVDPRNRPGYGISRKDYHMTPSANRYAEMAWRMIEESLDQIPLDDQCPRTNRIRAGIQKKTRSIYATIEDERLPLSRIMLVKGSFTSEGYSFNDVFRPTTGIEDIRVTLFHDLPYGKIRKAMRVVEKLTNSALTLKTTNEHIHRLLGQIYWWICQIKPWQAGDPSIAEMLIRSIAMHRGMELGPWKQGIISWVEVISQPTAEAFGDKFHYFFEH